MIEKFRSLVRREKAFTLVELLIVIAIIAILTVAFLPGALRAPAKARDAQRIKAVTNITAAVESYLADRNGVLPTSQGNFCLSSNDGTVFAGAGNADLTLLASYFPNSRFPLEPSANGNGPCNIAVNNRSYFYRNFGAGGTGGTNYAVASRVELQLSSNTTASIGVGTQISSANIDQLRNATANSGGGTGGPSVVATSATNPFVFLRLGP